VSTDDLEHSAPSFSPDGNEVFWTANRPPGPDNKEWFAYSLTMQRENGRWSAPRVTPFDGMPRFPPDGRRVYFHSREDIWVVEKQGEDWSEPRCLGLISRFPELKAVYMPSVTLTGTLYFIAPAHDSGIYRAELVNGEYTKPQLVPRNINLPPFHNWAPFIAPDESYLLFSSNRTGSLDDHGDLYISRRQADGSWTDPVSLGEPVNSPVQEVFPGLSPDGKYLFFCRYTPGHNNDVYWVSAATVPALRSMTNPPQENPK
jgi:Tol biopolymer transport system component